VSRIALTYNRRARRQSSHSATQEKPALPSLTVENYVKAIYQICAQQNDVPASTGKLAAAVAVSPGTVTSMLKTLSESELATYTPYEGVRLTSRGRKLALRVLRRHRLIELFLAKTLGLAWDEVHEEAENMEHAVSDRLIDRIDQFLGFPDVDPHGDPIPKADLSVASRNDVPLADCPVGGAFRLTRVLDQSPEFLRYLSESHLPLGAEGEVLVNREEAGIVTVRAGQHETTLGRPAAQKILVVLLEKP
jgi:DtxR family Mn-dependent transcriptional regulator